jgi:hypothetical protein
MKIKTINKKCKSLLKNVKLVLNFKKYSNVCFKVKFVSRYLIRKLQLFSNIKNT